MSPPNSTDDRVRRLEADVYYGNGGSNPALTVRMALVEDVLEKISDNLKWFVRLTVASMLTAIASIVVAIVVAYFKLK